MMMKGIWLYMGWDIRPWTLRTVTGDVNLWPYIEQSLISLNGMAVEQKLGDGRFTLQANAESSFEFAYTALTGAAILRGDRSMSNVHAHANDALVALSGRVVTVIIESGRKIGFKTDPDEPVYAVRREPGENWAILHEATVQSTCGIGRANCCVFLGNRGDQPACTKFVGGVASEKLEEFACGQLTGRIGNCKPAPREE